MRVFRLLLLISFAVPLIAGDAPVTGEVPATREITLRWKHPGPVAGFKVYTRLVVQDYGKGIDVAIPSLVDGVYVYPIELSNMDASYAVVTAYDAEGVESDHSNEVLYLLSD
jgi:hypothetical protein